jgi:hypothetical protein
MKTNYVCTSLTVLLVRIISFDNMFNSINIQIILTSYELKKKRNPIELRFLKMKKATLMK